MKLAVLFLWILVLAFASGTFLGWAISIFHGRRQKRSWR